MRKNLRHNEKHYSHFYSPKDLLCILLQNKISEKNGRVRFRGRVLSVGNQRTEGEIFVSLEVDSIRQSCFYGDSIWTKTSLYEINAPRNPGAFDFKSYAARKNIIHQLYLKEGSFVLNRGKSSGLPVASARLNQNLQRVMERALRQPREQAIAKALLLGDRNDIPEELLDRFKGAGAMHILAISGLHVGIIQLLLTFLTRPLRLLRWGRGLSMILVVTGLWGYALLTGMAVSSIRAVSMFTLLTIGQSVRRRSGMLNNLSNSAFVLLLFNPLYLLDVGFQLSYSALIGIGLGSGIMKKRKRQGTKKTRLRKYFFGLVQVSCAAQIGVMPMSLLYFNQFSGLFLVSSLILLPVLGSTLLFGYSVLIAASFFDLPSLVSKGLELWMGIIVKSINWLGGIDELIFEGVYFPLEFCFLTGAGLVMLTQAAARKKPVYLGISGFCLICMQLIWIHQRIELVRTEELMVFHIRGESLVVLRKGPVLHLKNSERLSEKGRQVLKDYSTREPGRSSIQKHRERIDSPMDLFFVGESLVGLLNQDIDTGIVTAVDSLNYHPDVLILTNAPRSNLERIIRTLRPGLVVVDGSNHPGFVRRCKATCNSLGIRFHSTFEEGALLYPK